MADDDPMKFDLLTAIKYEIHGGATMYIFPWFLMPKAIKPFLKHVFATYYTRKAIWKYRRYTRAMLEMAAKKNQN